MNNIRLFKHLVRLAQIAEELESTNPEAADLIDANNEEIADTIAPNEDNPDVAPQMFPKQDTPVIPYNQYETGDTEKFTEKQFNQDAKIPFSDALEITEEIIGEEPEWSQGVLENTQEFFDETGQKSFKYTNENEMVATQTEAEKIGDEIFQMVLPMIEEGVSDEELNEKIDELIVEKLKPEVK